jgi:hypothetical protein
MHETLDDATTAYILDTRRAFDDLRQVASQLAGLLVLAASGGRSAVPDHAMLHAAREAFTRAADEIRGARPSTRSRQHHGHLLKAVAAIDRAFCAASTYLLTRRSCGEGGGGDRAAGVDVVLAPLKAGYEQLQAAADRLPGFELIAFTQGCCSTTPEVRSSKFEV